ncbi:MAG: HD domain-containing protein [Bdellovibrionaceae bacterium]|nr:HD domain-containing protein [Bdellovibrionales bacterium]MCB9083494.1 HD domain-containing protein [Pseudobdellovibrionaceae bacterium]
MTETEAKEFLPIRVSTLRGDLKISFDAYVQVAGKFILYCRLGDSFEGSRLTRLREKKLKKLYIPPDHETAYRAYLEESIETAYDPKSEKPLNVRAEVIQGSQQAAAEEVMDAPEKKEFYDEARKGSKRFVEFLKRETFGLKAVQDVHNVDMNLAHHGVSVASLSVGIAEKLGFTEKFPLDILSLGCFLHDIEHHYTPVDYTRPLNSMNPGEKQLYLQHPQKGVDRVKGYKHFDEAVMRIILEHEEHIDGSGFPKGLRELQLDPMVMIASTANAFDRYVSFYKMSPKEALKELLVNKIAQHPLEYMKALQDELKFQSLI